jgi:hypothetical protein
MEIFLRFVATAYSFFIFNHKWNKMQEKLGAAFETFDHVRKNYL